MGQVQEQVAIKIGGGKEDLAKSDAGFGARRDALQCSQQAAVAHAVDDQVHLARARFPDHVNQETGQGALAAFYGSFVAGVGLQASLRRPAEEASGVDRQSQVAADLRRAYGRLLECSPKPMDEDKNFLGFCRNRPAMVGSVDAS